MMDSGQQMTGTEIVQPEISIEEFAVLARQTGLPLEEGQLERLREGFLKLQAMVADLNRPDEMTGELASIFRPEPVR